MSEYSEEVERHAKRAFSSATALAGKRFQNRIPRGLSPTHSDAASYASYASGISRRSTSLITDPDTAELFEQMSVATGVILPSKKKKTSGSSVGSVNGSIASIASMASVSKKQKNKIKVVQPNQIHSPLHSPVEEVFRSAEGAFGQAREAVLSLANSQQWFSGTGSVHHTDNHVPFGSIQDFLNPSKKPEPDEVYSLSSDNQGPQQIPHPDPPAVIETKIKAKRETQEPLEQLYNPDSRRTNLPPLPDPSNEAQMDRSNGYSLALSPPATGESESYFSADEPPTPNPHHNQNQTHRAPPTPAIRDRYEELPPTPAAVNHTEQQKRQFLPPTPATFTMDDGDLHHNAPPTPAIPNAPHYGPPTPAMHKIENPGFAVNPPPTPATTVAKDSYPPTPAGQVPSSFPRNPPPTPASPDVVPLSPAAVEKPLQKQYPEPATPATVLTDGLSTVPDKLDDYSYASPSIVPHSAGASIAAYYMIQQGATGPIKENESSIDTVTATKAMMNAAGLVQATFASYNDGLHTNNKYHMNEQQTSPTNMNEYMSSFSEDIALKFVEEVPALSPMGTEDEGDRNSSRYHYRQGHLYKQTHQTQNLYSTKVQEHAIGQNLEGARSGDVTGTSTDAFDRLVRLTPCATADLEKIDAAAAAPPVREYSEMGIYDEDNDDDSFKQESQNCASPNRSCQDQPSDASSSASRRSHLDFKNNDNSFYVVANLLIDFFGPKCITVDDQSRKLILVSMDREQVERLLPRSARLGFIEAIRHRLADIPEVDSSSVTEPMHSLVLQCRELGLDREGAENPILAAMAMLPGSLPVTVSVLATRVPKLPMSPVGHNVAKAQSTANTALPKKRENEDSVTAATSGTSTKVSGAGSALPAANEGTVPSVNQKGDSTSKSLEMTYSSAASQPTVSATVPASGPVGQSSDRDTEKPEDFPTAGSSMHSSTTTNTSNQRNLYRSDNGLAEKSSIAEARLSVEKENELLKAQLELQQQQLAFLGNHMPPQEIVSPKDCQSFDESLITGPDISVADENRSVNAENMQRQQLLAELREASNLMAESLTPETAKFWRDHVLDLQARLRSLNGEGGGGGGGGGSVTSRGSKHSLRSQTPDEILENNRRLLSEFQQRDHYVPPVLDTNGKALQPTQVVDDIITEKAESDEYGAPWVDVVAPADLPGGYHFEAEIEGQRFLATVPPGGVQQGETFTCMMRELDSVAIDIPVGYWKDDLSDVCKYGCCHPVPWSAMFCPLLALSQVQTRINLDFLGRPKLGPVNVANRTMMFTVMGFWVLMNLALFGGYNLKWSRGTELSVADWTALGLVNFAMMGFIIFVTQSSRSSLREKFMIREQRCYDLEDLCCATLCLPCTICQMSRHTANYDDYEAVCCSKTGLPDGVRVNQAPAKDVDGYVL